MLGYYFFSENNTAVYQSVKKQFKSRLIFNFHVDFGIIYLKNCIEFRCNFFRDSFFLWYDYPHQIWNLHECTFNEKGIHIFFNLKKVWNYVWKKSGYRFDQYFRNTNMLFVYEPNSGEFIGQTLIMFLNIIRC